LIIKYIIIDKIKRKLAQSELTAMISRNIQMEGFSVVFHEEYIQLGLNISYPKIQMKQKINPLQIIAGVRLLQIKTNI